jgi:uncharacterized Zn finger protein
LDLAGLLESATCYAFTIKTQPATLARLLTDTELERRATPANLRYGRAIYRRGGVEFIERTPRKVIAWVGSLDGSVAEVGSQRRRARLSSTAAGLRWHCTGNPKNHQIFCKHCVALALAIKKTVKRTAGNA